MTTSYDPARGSDLDRARELLGLVGAFIAVRTDEDLSAILERDGFNAGIGWLAAGLYAEYAQNPTSLSSAGESVSFANLLEVWAKLSARVHAQVADAGGLPPAGGVRTGQILAGTGRASKLR